MKTVFHNSMVAHVWAQQSQSEGRSNNGNFYFRDRVIYSYGSHFPIACFLTNWRGEKAVLITQESRSMSTGIHQTKVARALRDLPDVKQFRVPSLKSDMTAPVDSKNGANARYLWNSVAGRIRKDIAETLEKIKRMRKESNKEWAFSQCQAGAATIRDLGKFLGIPAGQLRPYDPGDLSRIVKAEALAIKAAQKEAAARQLELEAERKKHEAACVKFKVDHLDPLANAWRDGKDAEAIYRDIPRKDMPVGFGYGFAYAWHDAGGETMLRVKPGAADTIETSRGAEFPLTHAVKAWRMLKAIKLSGQPWFTNGHKIPIGHFHIDSVDTEGNIRAGCHFLKWSEVAALAGRLGLE
jgi:hypothetical protein